MKLLSGFILLCLSVAVPIAAQSNAIDAAAEGYIHDPTRAALPAARVTMRNVATNVQSETTANGDGYFRFPLLPVGEYQLTAEANGFKTATRSGIILAAGQKFRIELDMEVGSTSDSVNVTAEAATAQ